MTLLSENNKKEISVREIKKTPTLLPERYKYDITVREIQI